MSIFYALYVQDVSQSLQSYVATINTALVALGAIGLQDVNVTRLEDGPGRRGRLRTTISYTRTGSVSVGAAYFSANIPTDPGYVDIQAATFFAANPLYRSLAVRDIGDNLRGGLDSNAIMVLYATTPISNCGHNRARTMIVASLAAIASGSSGPAQMVGAGGVINGAFLTILNRTSFTWPIGALGYAVPRVGSCIIDAYSTCCIGPTIPAAPVIDPPSGFYLPPITVTITGPIGSTIYYTTDGSTPTIASTVYSGPFILPPGNIVRAVDRIGTGPLSDIATAVYTLPVTVATPVISPASGTVPSGQLVTITDATAGAVIHFTIDGSAPTAASPTYSGPFALSATTTVKAFAVHPDFLDSAMASSTFTVSSIATAAINALKFNAQVNSMVLSGNVLVIGGPFTTVTDAGGVHTRNRLCGVDVTTGLVTAWDPNSNGEVTKVAIDPTGRIWATGAFTTMGGNARGHVARFSATFVLDAFNALASTLVTTVVFDSVNAYIGGLFSSAGGSPRINLAAFALSNDALQATPITSTTIATLSMCFIGADLYVVGDGSTVNGSTRVCGYCFVGGTALNTWSPATNSANPVSSIATDGTSLFMLGSFTTIQATARSKAGALLPNATVRPWNPNLNANPGGKPDSLALSATAAYLAGSFTTVGGTGQSLFAKVDLATGALQAWNPGVSGQGFCVFYDSTSGKVFCGGAFTGGGGVFVLAA